MILRVQFDDEEQASFVILGLGPKVDVIAPASLSMAADHAAAVDVRYASAGR